MAIVFNDTFTGVDTTALTAHTPDTGSSWSVSGTATSGILSNANRARTSATGAANFNLANPVSALSTHDHTVSEIVQWMGSGGAGGSAHWLISHGGGNGPTGPSWAPSTGYGFGVNFETGTVTGTRNAVSIGTYPAGVAAIKTAAGGTLAANDRFQLKLVTATSGANCTVSLRLQRLSDNFWLQSDGTWAATEADMRQTGTYTDTAPLTVAPAGLAWYEYVGNTVGLHPDTFTIDVVGGALAAGPPIAVCTATAVTVYLDGTNGSTAPSGGTAPYTYQWHMSATDPGFTPGVGTTIGGATSQNLTVASPTTAVKYYKCVVTDAAAASVTTVEAPGRLTDGAVKAGFIGDSLYFNTPTGGETPPTSFSQYALYLGARVQTVAVSNKAVSGTKTVDWISASTNLVNAKTAFAAAGVTHVFIRLGANDALTAVTPATYLSNLTSCVNDLVAAGYKVLINYPTFGRPGGSYGGAVNKLMLDYQPQIDSLVNGTTIFAGDKKQWDDSAILSGWRQDDVHPSATGGHLLGIADMLALAAVLYPAAGGGLLAHPGMTGGMRG